MDVRLLHCRPPPSLCQNSIKLTDRPQDRRSQPRHHLRLPPGPEPPLPQSPTALLPHPLQVQRRPLRHGASLLARTTHRAPWIPSPRRGARTRRPQSSLEGTGRGVVLGRVVREFHLHVSSAAAAAAPGDSVRAGAGRGSEGQVGDGGGDGIQGARDVKFFSSIFNPIEKKTPITVWCICVCVCKYVKLSSKWPKRHLWFVSFRKKDPIPCFLFTHPPLYLD